MSQTWENAQKRGIAVMGTRATAVIAAQNGLAATTANLTPGTIKPNA
jgi:hypothetical protein